MLSSDPSILRYIESLELRDLSISYPKHPNALSHITLSFQRGKSYLLTGATASGKSSLLRFLKGSIPLYYPATISGKILLNGNSITIEEFWEYQSYFGFLFQDPELQTVGSTVEKDLAFGLENKGIEPDLIRNEVQNLSQKMQIQHLLKRKTSSLSGGEISLVSLASILILDPPFLLLDEFTAFLDYSTRTKILEVLKGYQNKHNTLIMVSHQIEETFYLADEIIIMDKGKIRLKTSPKHVFTNDYSIAREFLNLPEIYSVGIPICEKLGLEPSFQSGKELYQLLRRENVD